jgi:hypothetical protein
MVSRVIQTEREWRSLTPALGPFGSLGTQAVFLLPVQVRQTLLFEEAAGCMPLFFSASIDLLEGVYPRALPVN